MVESDFISQAVKNLAPDAEFTFTDNDVTTIKSLNGGKLPTTAAILKEIDKVKADQITKAAELEAKRQAIFTKLGLTADEVATLLA